MEYLVLVPFLLYLSFEAGRIYGITEEQNKWFKWLNSEKAVKEIGANNVSISQKIQD